MRVLLDTNVVLDFVLARQPFFIEADEIFIRLRNKETDIATAFSAIEELLKLVEIAKSTNQIYQNALTLNFDDYEDAV